jgi:hypothetical protein
LFEANTSRCSNNAIPRHQSHGVFTFRRSVATGLQRLGVRFEVTEAVLNHISGSRGGIAGVYQRLRLGRRRSALLSMLGRGTFSPCPKEAFQATMLFDSQ